MKLNEKQKIILTIVVVTLIVGGLGALNYFKFQDRGELLAQLDGLKDDETNARDLISQIPSLKKKRADLSNTINQYTGILPQEEHVEHEAFAEILDTFRSETLVVIQEVKPILKEAKDDEEPEEETNFLRYRYRISLVGTFPDFLRFINKIENHTRFLKIDEISIKPLGAANASRGLSDKNEAELLELAKVPFKEIQVVVSTYTYKKDDENAAN